MTRSINSLNAGRRLRNRIGGFWDNRRSARGRKGGSDSIGDRSNDRIGDRIGDRSSDRSGHSIINTIGDSIRSRVSGSMSDRNGNRIGRSRSRGGAFVEVLKLVSSSFIRTVGCLRCPSHLHGHDRRGPGHGLDRGRHHEFLHAERP
jgi:hypothetical protein